jgi:hypothetical protein
LSRRALLLIVCLACGTCGGQSPTGPTPGQPTDPLPPGGIVPPSPISPAAPQVFVGAGDIAMCDRNSIATAGLLDGIGGTVFTLGDNAYFQGTKQQYRDCYDPSWGRHKDRTFPVPGNHEYESPGAAPYYEYFGAGAGPAGLGYYSLKIGAWHVVALNSSIGVGPGSPQAAWLRSDLASNTSKCTVAYWHHPLFTSGPPGGDSPSMREFWRLLYDAGADLVLSAHQHMYERFAPQDPEGRADSVRGIRQFIAGTGGAFLYHPVAIHPNSEVRISAFGVLKLTLSADRYQWEFIPVSGPSDSGSGVCH